jgi:hypothetical protein
MAYDLFNERIVKFLFLLTLLGNNRHILFDLEARKDAESRLKLERFHRRPMRRRCEEQVSVKSKGSERMFLKESGVA